MEQYLRNIPRITLFILCCSIFLSGLTSFKLVHAYSFTFSSRIIKHYEIWRLFTSFFYYGDFNFHTFINTFIIFNASKAMELSGSAQYLYFLFLLYVISLISAYFITIPFISGIFFLALIYVTSRRHKDYQIALMGLPFQISAAYIPYIHITLDFTYPKAIGMIFGHIYYYFEDIYPQLPNSRNYKLLNTPMIFFKISDALRL